MSKNEAKPCFPSNAQRLAYSRRLKQQQVEHDSMAREVQAAKAAGREWPPGWTDEKKLLFRAGPAAEARRRQDAADERAEVERAEDLRAMCALRDALSRRLVDLDRERPYPSDPAWNHRYGDLFGQLRDICAEIDHLSADDWQDRIAGHRRRAWLIRQAESA